MCIHMYPPARLKIGAFSKSEQIHEEAVFFSDGFLRTMQ